MDNKVSVKNCHHRFMYRRFIRKCVTFYIVLYLTSSENIGLMFDFFGNVFSSLTTDRWEIYSD